MKKTILKGLALAFVMAGLPSLSNAQGKEEKKEIRVRVEKDVNGKKTVEERVIDVTGMSESQRQVVLDSVQSDLSNGKEFTKKRVKVIIDEENATHQGQLDDYEGRFEWNSDDGNEMELGDDNKEIRIYRFKDDKPRVRIQKRGSNNDFDWNSEDWENDFELKMDRLGNKLRYLGEDIPRRIERNTPIYLWDNQLLNGKSAPIRSLDVFPNRPDSHIINVRFYAPNEGDITIKVLDINGKIVASEEAKDFKGEYVGQVKLKKETKGTFFVIISQGDDGISERVVL